MLELFPTVAGGASSCPVCPACGGGRWRLLWRDSDWRLLGCRGCGLQRLWPPPPQAALDALYDDRYFSENYLASRPARLAHFRRLWKRVEPLVLGGSKARGRLLDVGCGPGFFLEVAAEGGWDVWGVERSGAAESVSARLRQRVARAPFGEDGHAESSFDVVTFWDVLAHLADPAAALRRAARLLRPDGSLVVKTPVRGPAVPAAARLLGAYGRPLLHAPQQIYAFTPAALLRLCLAHALEPLLLLRVGEARRGWLPAPTLGRSLARAALRAFEAVLTPRPALLLVARAGARAGARAANPPSVRAAGGAASRIADPPGTPQSG
jgi:SAM-dependent methyltransferase